MVTAILAVGLLVTFGCSGFSSGPSNSSSGASPSNNYPVPAPGQSGAFFGFNTNGLNDPWPGTMVPLGSWRSHDSSVKWADINTGPGVYDFSRLDEWLSKAKSTSTDVLYTMYATPSWISLRGANSSSPNMGCAYVQENGPGICDRPMDLACDGTGTNQTFKNFVTALVQHVGAGTIHYWELWNEPDVTTHWNPKSDCPNTTNAGNLMLARMARDMKAIISPVDANARFTSPPVGSDEPWLASYLSSTDGGNSADVIAFHGYPNRNACPGDCPEQVADQVDQLTTKLPASGQGKPLFNTEGSWGFVNKVDAITDPDQQASFLARYYLIQLWKGVARFYWYNWDIPDMGAFYDVTTNSLTPAAKAYVQVVRWTNGGTAAVGPCNANGTVWTCTIKSPSGVQAEAIWDSSQTCSAGTCTTTNVGVSSQYNAYLDLSGNTTNLSGITAPIGLKPILLINQ